MNEDWISTTGKEEYRKHIKEKVRVAAFKQYCELKQKCQTKLKKVLYSELLIQPYMISNKFSLPKKQLLWLLLFY